MDGSEFRRLRDLPGKCIIGDIRLAQRSDISAAWEAKDILITNADGVDARLTIQLVSETGAKTLNVKVAGVGPICRLEVDSRPHRPAGRSHKHALRTPDCPSDLNGRPLKAVFDAFCQMAQITHEGTLIVPPDLDGM